MGDVLPTESDLAAACIITNMTASFQCEVSDLALLQMGMLWASHEGQQPSREPSDQYRSTKCINEPPGIVVDDHAWQYGCPAVDN